MRKGPVPQPKVAHPSVCFPQKPKPGREQCVCRDTEPKHEPYAVHIEEGQAQARGHAA